MFLLVIAAFTAIGFLEIAPLARQSRLKELLLYSVLFGVAFVIILLLSLGINIPSPAKPMDELITILSKFFSS
jgi:hypothetical protein